MDRRYLTIHQFCRMLGFSRNWYYLHVGDPGFPQRVYFGGKPLLLREDCEAYLATARRQRPPKKNSAGAHEAPAAWP